MYVDAEEMEKVFNSGFDRLIAGSSLPGAPPASSAGAGAYDTALTPMDDDERVPTKKAGRKQILSDDEYLTNPSDDE